MNCRVPMAALSLFGYPKTQELQSTCADSWVHRVPENGHQPSSDAAIHYGVQLAQYCDQTLSCCAISREIAPSVMSLALRLRNTKVPVWTHESIGYPKIYISHWDAAIHYGVQLCPILWSNPILLRYFTKVAPSVLPCPKTQEHQSTCVDSWVHRVPENGHQPLGRGNSLWRSACPILWSKPYLVTLFHEGLPPLCSLALRLRNTKVPLWTHESIGYPKMGHQPLERGNSLWRSACPILWSNPLF